MAVKNVCPSCKKNFSAPESYVGRKVECPLCGHKAILRSPEELHELETMQEERQKKLEEDQKRLELIERMDIRRRHSSRPYYETYGTGQSAVRHFNPNSPSRYLRLRALSELFLLLAYVELVLVLMGVGLTVYLKLSGVLTSIPLLVLCLVGWGILGTVLYIALKLAGELCFLLSDLGDQQRDVTELLLDLRENTDKPVEREI